MDPGGIAVQRLSESSAITTPVASPSRLSLRACMLPACALLRAGCTAAARRGLSRHPRQSYMVCSPTQCIACAGMSAMRFSFYRLMVVSCFLLELLLCSGVLEHAKRRGGRRCEWEESSPWRARLRSVHAPGRHRGRDVRRARVTSDDRRSRSTNNEEKKRRTTKSNGVGETARREGTSPRKPRTHTDTPPDTV